jgi:hypothetical protein
VSYLTTGWRRWVFVPLLVLVLMWAANRLGLDGTHVSSWWR